jgi:response regulator of citrate/malate metabolism
MKSVLIVEDDGILAFVHQKYVEQIGYQVIACVETGQQAIHEVRNNEPDLILMDILLLGELDGIQTMGEIRTFSDVPVIYVSGNSDPLIRQRAINTSGSFNFLAKPINAEMLKTAFQQLESGISKGE